MGNVKNSARVDLEINVSKSDVKAKLQDIINQLDVIQNASALDLKFKNIKGISDLISSLSDLDKKLNTIQSDAKTAGSGLSENISGSASKAVQDISAMSSKTSEFAKELSSLANAGDLSKVQNGVKKLAESINTNLKMLGSGYQIDIDKLLNLGNAQQQIDMLSEGLVKFTAGWSTFGSASVKATDELKAGLDNAGPSVDKLKEKLMALKKQKEEFDKAASGKISFNEEKVDSVNSQNIEKYAAQVKDDFKQAIVHYKQIHNAVKSGTASEIELNKAFLNLIEKANEVERVQNTQRTFKDSSLTKWYKGYAENGVSKGASVDVQAVRNLIPRFRQKINAMLQEEINSIEQQIANEGINTTPKININPQSDPDTGKKVKKVVDASVPDKIETPVEVEPKITVDVTDKIKSLDDLITSSKQLKTSGEKQSARQEIIAAIADLQKLGMTFDEIKSKMSDSNKRTFTKKLSGEVDELLAKTPEVVSEIDKLNQMLGADFADKDKYTDIFEKVKSGALSAEEAFKQIKEAASSSADETKSSYKQVLDILNQIAAKEKEIQGKPPVPTNIDYFDSFNNFESIDEYKQKAQELFTSLYQAKKELVGSANKDVDFDRIQTLEQKISALAVSAENAGFKLQDIFNGVQLKTINSKNSQIAQFITVLKNYNTACESIISANNQVESSIGILRDKLLEMAKAANLSKDAYNTIVFMLHSIDGTTNIEQFANTIDGLLTGKIEPEITKLKNELNQLYPGKDFELKYINIFDRVKEGSMTAVQALEKIKQKEENIAEAAKKREEAQRKANEESSKPKASGGTTPSSGGTGTGTGSSGTGSGAGGTGTATLPASTNTEIVNLEQLKAKIIEVEKEIALKTQAFNNEGNVVNNVVPAELVQLEKLRAKLNDIKTRIDEKTSAFTNEQSVVTGVVDAEIAKLSELEKKLSTIKNTTQSSIQQPENSSLSFYDQVLEKIKQIREESLKIQHSPDTVYKFDNAYGWFEKFRNENAVRPMIDAAKLGISQLIEAMKQLQQIDKSISLNDYYRSDNFKEIREQLLAIDSLVRPPDASQARSWDALIDQIKSKFYGLTQFLAENEINLFSTLSEEQARITNDFNISSFMQQANAYFEEMSRIETINLNARDSIKNITKEILQIAEAAGVSKEQLKELRSYLGQFRGLFPKINDVDQTAKEILNVSGSQTSQATTGSAANDITTTFANERNKVKECVDAEIGDLNRLKQEVNKVETAIDNKTTAFVDEKSTVEQVINDEITKLSELEQRVSSITEKIKSISGTKGNVQVEGSATETVNNTVSSIENSSLLSSTLSNINHTLETLNGTLSSFTTQNNQEAPKIDIQGISNIAADVSNIYGILNSGNGENQTLAKSINSAVEALSNASKAIAEDAKQRVSSNEKYRSASERISTEAGRKDVLDRAMSGYKDYTIPDESSIKYSALSGGVTKVEAVLKDLEGKFYDFAATVDSQGVVAVQKLEENGAKSIAVQQKLAEQEQALARAQEEAARIKQQAIDNAEAEKVKATQTVPMKSLNGVIKGTEKSYDSYFSENKVPEKLKTEYTDLLKTIEQIRTEGRNLTQDEANQIEERCRNIQKEIELLKIKKEALAEQQSLSKKYTINTDALFDASKKGNIVGSGYEDKVKGIIQKINDELSKLKQTENGEIKVLDANSIEQSKIKLKELNAELQKTIKEAQDASKGSFAKGYEESLRKLSNSLDTFKQKTNGINLSASVNETLSKYDALISKLEELRTKMQSAPKGSAEESALKNQWDNTVKEAQVYQKELEKILDLHEKISKNGNGVVNINDVLPGVNANDINQRYDAMQKYLDSLNLADVSNIRFGKNQKTLTATFKDADGVIKQVTVSYNQMNNTLSKTITPVQKAATGWEKLTTFMGRKAKEMLGYFAMFGSAYRIIGAVRQGINYIKEIDLAMTELKKVTNETNQAYEQFLETASKTSKIIGSTIDDFVNATADFARLGYSIADATELAKAASIYRNVGDGINSVSDASESIISTMKAFGIEAEDAMRIVDRFNEVGNNFAISSTGIGEALQRSASALYEGGNTIDEAIGLITAANSVVYVVPRCYSNIAA